MKYAASTQVPIERSRGEIEKVLARYGAAKFAYFSEENRACIVFEIGGKRIRFLLVLPQKGDFRLTPERLRHRSEKKAAEVWEQACRQAWRSLSLIIKAKLEWVESKQVTIEEEFLSNIILATGKTVAETLIPDLNQIYATGQMPRLLSESFD